jgi:hypothetical protein
MRTRLARPAVLSALLGVVYGVMMRVALDERFGPFTVVSLSFLLFVPIAIGALVVYVDTTPTALPVARAIVSPWLSIFVFLLTTVVLLLEGSICILMVAPGFLILSSLGGLLGLWLKSRKKGGTATLSAILVLPFISSPIESAIYPGWEMHTISRSVVIHAEWSVIWENILNVPRIRPEELSRGVNDILGIPRPIDARMDSESGQSVRTTRWEKGISFREVVTSSVPGERIEWRFEFPPGSVPPGSLDDHVAMGGSHFKIDNGGYTLESTAQGETLLTLWTTYRISMRPIAYSRLWASLVLGDFHNKILNLIKTRAENVG